MTRDTSRPSLSEVMARPHLPALDGLRAVAVLIVISSHYGLPLPADLGVTFFFVLSGFLITWLLRREYRQTGTVSLRRFYLRRVLRIFPAYYVFLGVVLVARHLTGAPPEPVMMLAGAFYLMNYFNAWRGANEGPLAHAWSLAVEEQFYLLWPLAFRHAVARGIPAARIMVGGVIALVLCWRSYLFLVVRVGDAYVYNAFDTRVDTLAIGCLLALSIEVPAVVKALGLLASHAILPFATMALLLASRLGGTTRYHFSLGMTIDALLIALLLAQLLQIHSGAWGWLEHPVMRYVGAISYPMYLYHGFALRVAGDVPGGVGPQLAVAIILSIIAGTLSYRLIERPFLRVKHRFESVT